MEIFVEVLKAGAGLHQEQRPVHGAHGTHMQRFWVGGGASTPEEHTEHAKLHEKAATEHAALAKKHGAGLYPDVMPGQDPTHAIAAETAINPHWDPYRGDAHKTLSVLHRQAAGMAHGLARRVQTGLPTAHQQQHLATIREHIDDQTFYARPSKEVEDDLHREREGEDRDAYEREHDDGTPFDVRHPEGLKARRAAPDPNQLGFDFGASAPSHAGEAPAARGLHLEQRQVGGHTQGVWVSPADHHAAEHARLRDTHPRAAFHHDIASGYYKSGRDAEAAEHAANAAEMEKYPPAFSYPKTGAPRPHSLEEARKYSTSAKALHEMMQTLARHKKQFEDSAADAASPNAAWWKTARQHLQDATEPKQQPKWSEATQGREHTARTMATDALRAHAHMTREIARFHQNHPPGALDAYLEELDTGAHAKKLAERAQPGDRHHISRETQAHALRAVKAELDANPESRIGHHVQKFFHDAGGGFDSEEERDHFEDHGKRLLQALKTEGSAQKIANRVQSGQ